MFLYVCNQGWYKRMFCCFQIDSDFIAQYQMNYGVGGEEGGEAKDKDTQEYENYYNYYQVSILGYSQSSRFVS